MNTSIINPRFLIFAWCKRNDYHGVRAGLGIISNLKKNTELVGLLVYKGLGLRPSYIKTQYA